MKTLLRNVFVLVGSLAFVCLSHAQSKDAVGLADRLYERCGLAAQLGSFPAQFEQGVSQNRGKMPDELLAAIAQAGKTSFDPEKLRKDIVRSLAQKMPAADMKQVLAWLDGPVGRRITLAEERASGTMTPENMNVFFERQKKEPPGEKRVQLIDALIKAVKAVDVNANLIEAMALGIAVGADTMQPVQKRIGVSGLLVRLREAMPPEKLRASMAAALPGMMSYTYRNVSDADLAAYVALNRSALGVRYNGAVSAALAEALSRAGVRIGELLDPDSRKKSI